MSQTLPKDKGQFLSVPEGSLFWVSTAPSSPPPSPRPVLLFIHAGISDHTLWSPQSTYLSQKGWHSIQYDVFGYGQSRPDQSYLSQSPPKPINHHNHARQVLAAYHASQQQPQESSSAKCIIIGLSRGASTALDFALTYPDHVSGLIVCNGGVSGLPDPDPVDTPASQTALFSAWDAAFAEKNSLKCADLDVQIWGEGFDRPSTSRPFDAAIRNQLYEWCIDIERRAVAGTGGSAFPHEEPNGSNSAAKILERAANASRDEEGLDVKTAVAVGTYDEHATKEAMKYVYEKMEPRNNNLVQMREFNTAHLPNLEAVTDFNEWLDGVLTWMIEE